MAENAPNRLQKYSGPVANESGLPDDVTDLRKFAKFRPSVTGTDSAKDETTYVVFHAEFAHEAKPFLFTFKSMRRFFNYMGTAVLLTGLFLLGLLA